jgi:hypothetical protein
MRSLMPIAAIAVLLGSCAGPPEPAGAAFSRELAGHVAGQARTCISQFGIASLRVIDPQTVAYGTGRTIYVNHLPGNCPGLSPHNIVIVDAQSGQYCRGDKVSGLEPDGIIPGPKCNLGDWVPYQAR